MTQTLVKERPILFSSSMVRAILDGKKTQTRRVVKNPERFEHLRDCAFCSPYGHVGDHLWVRETWRPSISHHCAMDTCDCADVNVRYAADGESRFFSERNIDHEWLLPKAARTGNVSPLFMPRWASRLTLEITGVRVERLQEISGDDAIAEGAPLRESAATQGGDIRIDAFADLWGSINGKTHPWSSNPWVWVIAFQRVEATP
jgi:hypothetical protein